MKPMTDIEINKLLRYKDPPVEWIKHIDKCKERKLRNAMKHLNRIAKRAINKKIQL